MKWWMTVVLLLVVVELTAQCDSAFTPRAQRNCFSQWVDRSTSSRLYQMTYIGVPLIVGGVIVKNQDDHFRNLRHSYVPSFRQHYDDYLQYAPAALMLGLKAGGVQSRSSWGRMLVSDAFSVGIMAAVVNPIKSATRVMRPDGSSANSFPSGHTATAFMVATMLHKEYGWRSPWYSVAGYSMATATGLSRMLNNRHWLSDVMVGAGIGILATELGYFLADLIYKDRGCNIVPFLGSFDRNWRPSFLGFRLGFDVVPGTYRPLPAVSMDFMTGSTVGLEGAWFFTPYMGVGTQMSLSSIPFKLDGRPQEELLRSASAHVGLYLSYPISVRWIAGAKVLAGYSYYDSCRTEFIPLGGTGGFGVGAGLSMMYRVKQNMSLRFFYEYKVSPAVVAQSSELLYVMTFGGSIDIGF